MKRRFGHDAMMHGVPASRQGDAADPDLSHT